MSIVKGKLWVVWGIAEKILTWWQILSLAGWRHMVDPGQSEWYKHAHTHPHTHVHFHLNMFIRTDDDVGAVSGAKLVLLSLDALWVWQNKNTSNEYLNSLYLLQNIWFKVRETTLTCTFVLKSWMSGSWPLVFGLLLLRIIDSWASSGESHHAG